MRIWGALGLVAALIWGSAAVATEGDSELGKSDPYGPWREVSRNDGTSQCLGKPDSPVCAVETIIACTLRGQPDLCRTALPDGASADFAGTPDAADAVLKYRVLAVRPGPSGEANVIIQPRRCETADPHCQQTFTRPVTYVARKAGERWVVVSWGSPKQGGQ